MQHFGITNEEGAGERLQKAIADAKASGQAIPDYDGVEVHLHIYL